MTVHVYNSTMIDRLQSEYL